MQACFFFMLFILNAAVSNIFVLLTFEQPTFKVLFNLSQCCEGCKQHLNNLCQHFTSCTVRGCRQLMIYTLLHQKPTSIFRVGGRSVYLFLKQMFISPFYHLSSRKKHVSYNFFPLSPLFLSIIKT